MDLPPELEKKLIAAALECAAVSDDLTIVHPIPQGRLVIDISVLPPAAESAAILKVFGGPAHD